MTEYLREDQLPELAESLLAWFAQARRPLPWRETYDPYSVWISEIMLQQTQMERGVGYFTAWMRRFPDIPSIAHAGEEAVLAAWEGLGYYSRARNLYRAAVYITEEFGGEFPRGFEAIRDLPGVGEYTAGAIASIAFEEPVPAVDANVLRIFARLCDMDQPPEEKAARSSITEMAQSLLAFGSPRLLNQALMELGALVCSRNPACAGCPAAEFCAARRHGTAAQRPVKPAAKQTQSLEMAAAVPLRNGEVYIRKRPDSGLWAGLWEFPCGVTGPDESPETAALRCAREAGLASPVLGEKIAVVRHGYTTWRVTLHGWLLETADGPAAGADAIWVPVTELARYAFPAGHRKLVEKLGWKEKR